MLPLSPGRAESHGFEYKRNGTLSLFAALNVATGEVLGKTAPRHTSAQFVAFLTEVVSAQLRGKEIHVICDNVSSHKTDAVRTFLADHPRVSIHYTPTYSSWLNQVENWFARIQHQGSRQKAHAVHPSIQQASAPIEMEVLRSISANPVQFIRFSGLGVSRHCAGSCRTGLSPPLTHSDV
ncbi:hypothetical protein BN2475_930013 [Paraburkholderia ribeironis]|uniref:Tc1-like transposase DDE domain-containing protein n=1 Tax=Paraburkholderia ribeironis TaxID=1247936 RepID=A0A1N7SM93_9BURK|nr:hypothetical protein BN2475_930013 [Paraburkholderia ribeironis]